MSVKKNKLKIFHALFTDNVGGLEQSYIDYCKALIMCGHDVTCLVLPNAPYIDKLKELSFNIITQRVHGFYDVFAWCSLKKLFNKHKPDIVLAHNGRAIFTCRMALTGNDTPLIGVSHSNTVRYSKKASALITLTEDMRRHFVKNKYPEDRCVVMNNMIDLSGKKNIQNYCINTPLTIGFLGRLSPEKGADQIVNATSILKKKNYDIKTIIAGDGEEKLKLQSMANKLAVSDDIEFQGWVYQDEKAEFFNKIDILCVPSYNETFGIVVLEAWAHGVLVIASEVDGLAAIISDNINGILYPRGDYNNLAETIEKILLDNGKIAEKIVMEGSKKVDDFGIKKSSGKLDNILFALKDKIDSK
ncbi:MAG: glycosyltransferase family 4 protein [Rickettsiales bacterium]